MSPERETISDYPIKPRRTKGTRSYNIRNRVAGVVLAIGVAIGTVYSILPSTRKVHQYFESNHYGTSEATKLKKFRLAPFINDKKEFEPSTSLPVIVDPQSASTIAEIIKYQDPLNIKTEQ